MDDRLRALERAGDRAALRAESLRAGIAGPALEDVAELLVRAMRRVGGRRALPRGDARRRRRMESKATRIRALGWLPGVLDAAARFGCAWWTTHRRGVEPGAVLAILAVRHGGDIVLGANSLALADGRELQGEARPNAVWPTLRGDWPADRGPGRRELEAPTPLDIPVRAFAGGLARWAEERSDDRISLPADGVGAVVSALLERSKSVNDGPMIREEALRLYEVVAYATTPEAVKAAEKEDALLRASGFKFDKKIGRWVNFGQSFKRGQALWLLGRCLKKTDVIGNDWSGPISIGDGPCAKENGHEPPCEAYPSS